MRTVRGVRPLQVLALVTMLASSAAQAQLASLLPGVRARIRAPGVIAGRQTGTVLERTADSLAFGVEYGVQVRLALASLTSVDVSGGKSRARGAVKGALWGIGVGLLSGVFSDSDSGNCTSNCVSRGEVFAAGVLGGAMGGAIIGTFVRSERWEKLSLPVRTAVTARGGGGTLAVSLRF